MNTMIDSSEQTRNSATQLVATSATTSAAPTSKYVSSLLQPNANFDSSTGPSICRRIQFALPKDMLPDVAWATNDPNDVLLGQALIQERNCTDDRTFNSRLNPNKRV